MRKCTVSLVGEDGEKRAINVEASSLFAAAYAAVNEWGKFWFFPPDGVIEVRAGEEYWRVRLKRVSEWYAEMYRSPQRGRVQFRKV